MKNSVFNSNVVSDPGQNPKKELWKTIFQTVINILVALATALGVTSCMSFM